MVLCSANLFFQSLSVIGSENNIRKAEAQENVAARSIVSQYGQLADLCTNDKTMRRLMKLS
jgi:hypothetical protein